jgi:penicillin-binding protein 1C
MSAKGLLTLPPGRPGLALRLVIAAVVVPPLLLWLYAHLAPLPDPERMLTTPGTVVLAADGSVLQRDTSAGVRIPVTLAQVAPIALQATIAAEDQRFRSHPGVDPIAIARAILTRSSQPSGASTITQQLARRLYLRDAVDSPYVRKIREALLALQLEARRSKDQILELYLNDIYYGRGAYGIEAASRVYFGVSARDLDLAQASLLVGLPQLPVGFDSFDLSRAQVRQRYVLDRLVAGHAISAAQADEASARRLAILPELAPPLAPHFVRYALDELARAAPEVAGRDGLIVRTTLDAGLQRAAERSVAYHLGELRDKNVGNAAVVVLEPSSGRVVAMVGSANYADDAIAGQINMAIQPRQPGSALKPFLYLAALEHGYTAATPLLDVPVTFETATGPYTPMNADRRFHGLVPLRVALGSSFNVPAVRTLDALGVQAFLEIAHRFGLHTLTNSELYGLALTLGGGEVRPLDLAAAYGGLANGGGLVEPFAIARVQDATGALLYESVSATPARVASRENAFIIGDILSDPLARIPGFGEVTPLDTTVRAAVKTGTTTSFRDNWTVGYTPDRVVAVWVGNSNNQPMERVSGVDGAAPIWRDVIEAATASTPNHWPAPPPTLVRRVVCAPTGLLPGPACPTSSVEWFVSGTEPQRTETYYARAADGSITIDPPVEARLWAREAGFGLGEDPAPDASAIQITRPAAGAVFFVSPELRAQELLLKVSGPSGTLSLELRVDGVVVSRVEGGAASATWALVPGTHRVEAIAELSTGARIRASRTFEVRTT